MIASTDRSRLENILAFLGALALSYIFILRFRASIAVIALICIFFLLFLFKRNWAVYAIIVTLYFEAELFSFYLLGARIRIVQAVGFITFGVLILSMLAGKLNFKRTPLDFPLWAYLAMNFISIINTPSLYRSLKIAVLLAALVALYYIIINLITQSSVFEKAFNLLLYTGIAIILYGIYQVAGRAVNFYFNLNLPVDVGIAVNQYSVSSLWRRPDATFIEADWYGAIAMFYSVLFTSLYFSIEEKRKKFYLFGMIVSIAALVVSLIRAAWLGFLAAIFFLHLFRRRVSWSKFNLSVYLKIAVLVCLVFMIVVAFIPVVHDAFVERFEKEGPNALSMTNVRFIQMKYAMRLFLDHPIIGNGPGTFAIHGIWGDSELYYQKLVSEGNIMVAGRYDPSIITTVFEDTGIIGAIFFFWFILRFLMCNIRTIPLINNRFQIFSLSLFAGMIGLLVSYIFTHGFWITFTWVFLGLNMKALEFGKAAEG